MAERYEFQAEVKQVLDIVIHSLYTDRDIFLRELVSNASDANEKARHLQLAGQTLPDENLPFEVNVSTDETAGTITVQDFGIGLTREELVENLGTIAHSGSKAFLEALKASGGRNENLIGQFGVGFYSAFMVADEVTVYTHSAKPDGGHWVWKSDGSGAYEIEESSGQRRGAKVVLKLKEDCKDFAKKSRVESILKQYSSFVPFPINLNGEKVNTVEAIWLKNKAEISEEQYKEFYKFQSNAWDEPRFWLHFNADAPLEIHSVLFVPQENTEKFGFGRFEPGVSLYCRKVLIERKPENLLPEWLRFLRGIVDSADLPLNISRESMQDSSLIAKLGSVLSKRFIKEVASLAEKNPEKFEDFYQSFNTFLKEGVVSDFANREALAKLLRYESSVTEPGKQTSLPEYLSRMKEGQKGIYFLSGASREGIEKGPYIEGLRASGLEVLYLYEPIDEFVMNHLREFEGKPLESADSSDLEVEEAIQSGETPSLTREEVEALCKFLKEHLGEKVGAVRPSKRLVNNPAIVLNTDKFASGQMRRLLKQMQRDAELPEVPCDLEINPAHPLLANLNRIRETDTELATLLASQIFDQARVAAGLVEDQTSIIQQTYDLLERLTSK
ncbi:MAG: molecular chaperone HtpG [Puniceicoccaceae bacterium]